MKGCGIGGEKDGSAVVALLALGCHHLQSEGGNVRSGQKSHVDKADKQFPFSA